MNNVFGYEKEKKQMLELKNFLLNLDRYRELGVRIPRGVLLEGSPGVGKTSLAMMIASEDINMVCIRACSCCEDEAIPKIVEAFDKAKKKTPAVILLDELDKIAGTSPNFFMEENDNVKKVLLQEIDDLKENDGIMVLATCNDIENIGSALIRAGRFDRVFHIDKPREADRKKILTSYFEKITLNKNIDMDELAKKTSGMTGAELECIANESGIYAISNNIDAIDDNIILKVINQMTFQALEGEINASDDELYKIAIHEAGHALVAKFDSDSQISSVSIMPQGGSLGHVSVFDEEDTMTSIESVRKKINVSLAGRVAERELLGEIYTGAKRDLGNAMAIARELVLLHGYYGYEYICGVSRHSREIVSDRLLYRIEQKVANVLTESDHEVRKLINENKQIVKNIANALLEKRVLTSSEIDELTKDAINPFDEYKLAFGA